MCLWASYKKKKNLFASLKSVKKGVGSGVGSGSEAGSGAGSVSISQRSGSGDPDPHQNITDPQYWFCDFLITCYLWRLINVNVPTVSGKQRGLEKIFFANIFKVSDEKSKDSRIRICLGMSRIRNTAWKVSGVQVPPGGCGLLWRDEPAHKTGGEWGGLLLPHPRASRVRSSLRQCR